MIPPVSLKFRYKRLKAVEGRGCLKYCRRTIAHLRKKYILVMFFIFSSEKYKCLLFRVVSEAGQPVQPNTKFSGTIPVEEGWSIHPLWSQETSQDKAHNGRPCRGLLQPGGQAQRARANHRPRKWTCTSGSEKCQPVEGPGSPAGIGLST